MTPGEKQLLLKDLCARLPYGIMCHANEINLDGKLLFINKLHNIVALYNDKAIGKFDTCQIADVKPYLRSMSSMTEEEENELVKIAVMGGYNDTIFNSFVVTDWLDKKMFDHRGLIPMELALEAPDRMYN